MIVWRADFDVNTSNRFVTLCYNSELSCEMGWRHLVRVETAGGELLDSSELRLGGVRDWPRQCENAKFRETG